MECKKCSENFLESQGKKTIIEISGQKYSCLNCPVCQCSVSININGQWKTLFEILKDDLNPKGWRHIHKSIDYVRHYILSQVLYKNHEGINQIQMEAEFDSPDDDDDVRLLTWDNDTVGFYTLKSKGTIVLDIFDYYSSVTLDTCYIRPNYRGRGFASSMLDNILEEYPEQSLSVSTPISTSMRIVLFKYLQRNPKYKNLLWEIEGCGVEGQRKLIWYQKLNFHQHNNFVEE